MTQTKNFTRIFPLYHCHPIHAKMVQVGYLELTQQTHQLSSQYIHKAHECNLELVLKVCSHVKDMLFARGGIKYFILPPLCVCISILYKDTVSLITLIYRAYCYRVKLTILVLVTGRSRATTAPCIECILILNNTVTHLRGGAANSIIYNKTQRHHNELMTSVKQQCIKRQS